jgi:hypothetical protein
LLGVTQILRLKMDELRAAEMACPLQADKQAFHFIEVHLVRRKAGDILHKRVKLGRNENDLVQ